MKFHNFRILLNQFVELFIESGAVKERRGLCLAVVKFVVAANLCFKEGVAGPSFFPGKTGQVNQPVDIFFVRNNPQVYRKSLSQGLIDSCDNFMKCA